MEEGQISPLEEAVIRKRLVDYIQTSELVPLDKTTSSVLSHHWTRNDAVEQTQVKGLTEYSMNEMDSVLETLRDACDFVDTLFVAPEWGCLVHVDARRVYDKIARVDRQKGDLQLWKSFQVEPLLDASKDAQVGVSPEIAFGLAIYLHWITRRVPGLILAEEAVKSPKEEDIKHYEKLVEFFSTFQKNAVAYKIIEPLR